MKFRTETVREVDGAVLGVFRERLVVVAIDVVAGISAGCEIDACGKRHVGVGFRVLRMRPRHAEVFLFRIVWRAFVAGDGRQVADVEVAGKFIAFPVRRLRGKTPRAFRVYFSGEGEIDIVVDCEIVSSVAQVKSLLVVVAECRENDAGRIF